MRIALKTLDQLWVRIIKDRVISGDHWLYNKYIRHGYGSIWFCNSFVTVHRVSAALHLGLNIKNDREIVCHKNECNTKNCFNPDHLYIGSQSSNVCDIVANGNNFNLNKTFCPHGHEYTKENTKICFNKGSYCHRCRTCINIKERERYNKCRIPTNLSA